MPADCPTGNQPQTAWNGALGAAPREAHGILGVCCAQAPRLVMVIAPVQNSTLPGPGEGASHHTPEGGEPKTMKVPWRTGRYERREGMSGELQAQQLSAGTQPASVPDVFNENIND